MKRKTDSSKGGGIISRPADVDVLGKHDLERKVTKPRQYIVKPPPDPRGSGAGSVDFAGNIHVTSFNGPSKCIVLDASNIAMRHGIRRS